MVVRPAGSQYNPVTQGEGMIDLTTNQHLSGVDRDMRFVKDPQSYRDTRGKCDAYNLPLNLDSNSDDYESEYSSEDENDKIFHAQTKESNNEDKREFRANDLSRAFENLNLTEERSHIYDKLTALVKKYKKIHIPERLFDQGLKTRSPFRNRPIKCREIPFERPLHVSTAHGNGASVYIQRKPSDVPQMASETDIFLDSLLEALDDVEYVNFLKNLSREEEEKFIFQIYDHVTTQPTNSLNFHDVTTASTSPKSVDCYDSSYESGGSPSSTNVTSPGSPSNNLRCSISSESDQELEESHSVHSVLSPSDSNNADESISSSWSENFNNTRVMPCYSMKKGFLPLAPSPSEKLMGKTVQPLGEVVRSVATSASQRLEELSKTNSLKDCYVVQLVRVFSAVKGETASDSYEGFCKSLMSTMKTKLSNKTNEENIWQLSIYTHIRFLISRVTEYRRALRIIDEYGNPLLHIAAIDHAERPLIARYIAESMAKVGYDPLKEVDSEGNSVIHRAAIHGDSYISMLSELLMSRGPDDKPLFGLLMPNMHGQTPLHLAVQSSQPHLNTVLLLLKHGADPFIKDKCQITALSYYVQQHASGDRLQTAEDFEVVRKMLQAPVSLSKPSVEILKTLYLDKDIPSDVKSLIQQHIRAPTSKIK